MARFHTAMVLAVLAVGLAACGSGPGNPNGFWVQQDGGYPGLIVYRAATRDEWFAQQLSFEKIKLLLETPCTDFAVSANGLVTRDVDSARTVSPDGSAWRLALELSPAFVDAQYRRIQPDDAGVIVGTVTAGFDGGLHGDAVDELTFSYEIAYRDSVKVLATEGTSFVLRRATACP